MADRFKANRFVLGYDLLNEPWPGTRWRRCRGRNGCPRFDADLSAFVARTLAAIRARDPRTLVFYEPHVLFNDGVPTHLRDTGDPERELGGGPVAGPDAPDGQRGQSGELEQEADDERGVGEHRA